jgi:hypothetical protein
LNELIKTIMLSLQQDSCAQIRRMGARGAHLWQSIVDCWIRSLPPFLIDWCIPWFQFVQINQEEYGMREARWLPGLVAQNEQDGVVLCGLCRSPTCLCFRANLNPSKPMQKAEQLQLDRLQSCHQANWRVQQAKTLRANWFVW